MRLIGPAPLDGKISTGAIDDNAITLAKMASGTDGNIITYDTSGNPAAVATGSSGQVLKSAGAGAVPSFGSVASGRTIAVKQKALGYFASTSINGNVLPTNWSLAHTMAASTNAILFQGFSNVYNPACSGNVYCQIKLYCDGSAISESSAPDSGSMDYYASSYFSSQNYFNALYVETLFKPDTSSEKDYELYVYGNTGGQASSNTSWGQSFIRVTELDGSICTAT